MNIRVCIKRRSWNSPGYCAANSDTTGRSSPFEAGHTSDPAQYYYFFNLRLSVMAVSSADALLKVTRGSELEYR